MRTTALIDLFIKLVKIDSLSGFEDDIVKFIATFLKPIKL